MIMTFELAYAELRKHLAQIDFRQEACYVAEDLAWAWGEVYGYSDDTDARDAWVERLIGTKLVARDLSDDAYWASRNGRDN